MTFFRSLLLAILLLPCLAWGQDVSVRDLKGLHTAKNPLMVAPNEATTDHNWDHRELGSIAPRKGYDSVSVLVGMDSLVNLFAFYESDGEQRLVVVGDSSGVGYGSVYLTNPGSVNITSDSLTKLTDYWAIDDPSWFVVYNDHIYMNNGLHRGLAWNGNHATSWPLAPPGEPKIIPIKLQSGESSAYALNGEYRYLFKLNDRQTESAVHGVISSRVRVTNGRVLITDFSIPSQDTMQNNLDSLYLTIYRTSANPGPLRENTVFGTVFTGYVRLADSTGADSSLWRIDSLPFIDSIPDGSLSGTYNYQFDRYGRDTLANLYLYHRYGSPRYVGRHDSLGADKGQQEAGDTAFANGVYYGTYAAYSLYAGGATIGGSLENRDVIGVQYACTFIDTLTGLESDTGCSIFLADRDTGSNYWIDQYTLSLPKPPDTNYAINLYRAYVYRLSYDSSTWVPGYSNPLSGAISPGSWKSIRTIGDTINTEFRLQGQYAYGDTLVTDDVRADSIITRRQYEKTLQPTLLKNLTVYKDRIFGIDGNRVHYTDDLRVDTIQSWGALQFTTFDENDGDAGTGLFVSRGALRFMKNNQTYNLYETSGGTFEGKELAGSFGAIAPQSITQGITGTYYLSNAGVILETEGLYRERQIKTGLVSDVLDNFDKLSISDKRTAIGFKLDREHKYFLSVPAVDTTYVWDERAGQWATWNLVFSDAVLYGTESSVDFIPGDTMYFIRPGDSVLYKYGTRSTDNGTTIDLAWKGGVFGVSEMYQTVERVGLWTRSDSTRDSVAFFVRNDQNESNGSIIVDSLYLRFRGIEAQSNVGLFHSIDILTNTTRVRGDMYIDGYDVWVRKAGDYPWR